MLFLGNSIGLRYIKVRALKLINYFSTQTFFNGTNYFNVRLTHVHLSSARPVVSVPKGLTLLLLLVGWWEILARDMDTIKKMF